MRISPDFLFIFVYRLFFEPGLEFFCVMKVVFHLSTDSSGKVSEMLGNIKNLWADDTVEIESTAALLNAEAVRICEKGSEASEFLEPMIEAGLKLKVCSNSIKGMDIAEDDLIQGVEVVSSGVGELNKLQTDDYNYIRI